MSALKKRSINLHGHATSVTMEEPFWDCLKDIAKERKLSLNALIAEIDEQNAGNLSSALRVYVLKTLQTA
ncbi:MAG: ribbon-helix-helix domain-containing protein [Alphaproteobacteria bacterium]|nr:ribbon-helix-helix domain-containing protein [Alphaproteobacteria bacterium]